MPFVFLYGAVGVVVAVRWAAGATSRAAVPAAAPDADRQPLGPKRSMPDPPAGRARGATRPPRRLLDEPVRTADVDERPLGRRPRDLAQHDRRRSRPRAAAPVRRPGARQREVHRERRVGERGELVAVDDLLERARRVQQPRRARRCRQPHGGAGSRAAARRPSRRRAAAAGRRASLPDEVAADRAAQLELVP